LRFPPPPPPESGPGGAVRGTVWRWEAHRPTRANAAPAR
jgi:hypothetical protein